MRAGEAPIWGLSKIAVDSATVNSQKTSTNAIPRTVSRPCSVRKSSKSQSGTFLARERNLCVCERYLHVASLFNVVWSISMLHIFRFLQILDFRRKIHENCFSGYDRAHNGSVQIPASLIRQKTPYPSSRPPPPQLNVEAFSMPSAPLPPLAIQCC